MNPIVKKLKAYQDVKGWPKARMAREIGISVATYHNNVTGANAPYDYTLGFYERYYAAHKDEIEAALAPEVS